MTTPYNSWTAQDLALLRDMAANGASIKKMAQRLGRATSTVSAKATQFGIPIATRQKSITLFKRSA